MSSTGNVRTLGDLPDELLIQILDSLPSQRDLWASCLVSRRMNSIADPVLHKSILFDQPKHHLTFSESLTTRPRRGSLIQNVRLDYPSSELADFMWLKESTNRIDGFSHAISTMSNLEKLIVSVPESLSHGIGSVFNGPFDLPCLKTCNLDPSLHSSRVTSSRVHTNDLIGTLYYQTEDGGYWDLQENIHIFSHPTLENLTIRRAKLDERGFESLEQPSETALKELHLIDCDINDDALSDILLLPEALKVITISQLEDPSPPLEESPDDVGDYVLAMRSSLHSLETISIDFATLSGDQPLRLREFQSLTSLQLRDYQLFGQSSGSPRLHSVGLPPNLERLRFFNQVGTDEEIADLFCYTIENQDMLARKVCEIIIPGPEDGLPAGVVEACKTAEHFHLQIQ